MSIKKVTLASLILLSLTACSSGGSSNDNATNQAVQDQKNVAQAQPAEKAEAERLAAEQAAKEADEKAEAERLAAEQATKEAAEKAEAERLAAEQAVKEAAEKAEAERLAAEQAVKEATEKAEAKRLAAEQAAKEAAEKAEAERLAAEQAVKEAAEKAEAERLAAEQAVKEAAEKAEAERLAAEQAAKEAAEKAEAERLAAEQATKEATEKAKLEKIKNLALKAGYSDSDAERFAQENLNTDPNVYLSTLGWEKYEKVKQKALEAGLSEEQANQLSSEYSHIDADIANADQEINKLVSEIAEYKSLVDAKGFDSTEYGLQFVGVDEKQDGRLKVRTQEYLYNRPYSVVRASIEETSGWNNGTYIENRNRNITVKGLKTEVLPVEGKATYEGTAFNYYGDTGHSGGYLTYNVNFSNRTGYGKVEGDYAHLIMLDEGKINNGEISSTAHHYYDTFHHGDGKYSVEFFGPNAEEIGGKIEMETDVNGRPDSFGLSGTRGEITK